VKHWLGHSWPFLFLGGTLIALVFPHLVGAYHLEAGGQAIDDVEQTAADPLPAFAHLQKAIQWTPDNAQAYRLLGKVYRLQHDWVAAAEALTRYTELRPGNPLGHVELAEVYEAIDSEIAAMGLVDLIAALPQAAVEAPDRPADTPYAQLDGPAWRSYVATSSLSLPPNFGERPTLFMHPPSRIFYDLSLPVEPAALRFGMGLAPEVLDWPGDGVTFEVSVNGEPIFQEHLDKVHARQAWQERVVDLVPWAGQAIVLTLGVGPGPTGDLSGDWAGWGDPQVVDARLPALEALHPGARMEDEWRRAGVTAQDLTARGEEARKAKQYDEALVWYERAMRLEPHLGDPWYYVGLLHEHQERWPEALDAYRRATASRRFRQVGRSSPHYRAGIIYQVRLEPRQVEKALTAYETATELDDFGADWEAADCHFKRGEILWWQKDNPDEYIAEFQKAIELNPKHASAHILLGRAYYAHNEDVEAAEAELHRAAEVAPRHSTWAQWAYVHLGDIYRQEGRRDEAALMYQQALDLDPDFEPAQTRMLALIKGD
jgi:tetratricopeptide (TPR) repeat protein